MSNPILLNKCPNCNGLAAITSNPHCTRNPACTWNVCSCGHTYDRHTGNHFHTDPQRPTTTRHQLQEMSMSNP